MYDHRRWFGLKKKRLDAFDASHGNVFLQAQPLLVGNVVSTSNRVVFLHVNGHDDLVGSIHVVLFFAMGPAIMVGRPKR